MAKISLVLPPVGKVIRKEEAAYPPLGLLYIAAVLEGGGHEVEVIDSIIEGLDQEGLRKRLMLSKPDMVGIGVFTVFRFQAFRAAEIAKGLGCTVVMGGSHVSPMARKVLEHYPFVDMVVRGEGEYAFLEIADGKRLNTIRGLTYRRGGKIFENPDRGFIEDLDSMPFPARHLVPMERYFSNLKGEGSHLEWPATTIMTARGCPNNCTYCTTPRMWGRRVRKRSPKNVVDEIELLQKEYGVRDLRFFDDTFNISKDWMKGFAHELEARGIRIRYSCLARVNTADREMLELMKRTGCYDISFGVESGSQKVLDGIRKGIRVEQVERAARISHELGMWPRGFFMLGLPGEGLEDMCSTLELIGSVPFYGVSIAVTLIFPGSEMFYQSGVSEDVWFREGSARTSGEGALSPTVPTYPHPDFSEAELNRIACKIASEGVRKNFWRIVKRKWSLSKPKTLKYLPWASGYVLKNYLKDRDILDSCRS